MSSKILNHAFFVERDTTLHSSLSMTKNQKQLYNFTKLLQIREVFLPTMSAKIPWKTSRPYYTCNPHGKENHSAAIEHLQVKFQHLAPMQNIHPWRSCESHDGQSFQHSTTFQFAFWNPPLSIQTTSNSRSESKDMIYDLLLGHDKKVKFT